MTTVGIAGLGFTVIEKLPEGPAQPPAVGITEMVATIGAAPLFANVKDAMLLVVPLDARPIEVVVLLQEYEVPESVLVKFKIPEVAPAHLT